MQNQGGWFFVLYQCNWKQIHWGACHGGMEVDPLPFENETLNVWPCGTLSAPSSEFCVMAIWESLGHVGNRTYIYFGRWRWKKHMNLYLKKTIISYIPYEYHMNMTNKSMLLFLHISSCIPTTKPYKPPNPHHLTHTTYPQQPTTTRMTSTRRCIRLNGPLWSTTSRAWPWLRLLQPPRIRWLLGGAMVSMFVYIWWFWNASFPWVSKKNKVCLSSPVLFIIPCRSAFQLRQLEKRNPAGSSQCFNASILMVSCRRFTWCKQPQNVFTCWNIERHTRHYSV